MKRLAARVLRSRLARNVSVNVYNQIVQVAVQLAAVPILSIHWGLKNYGVWLILFTIPSYLAMADLGFASAAGNDMTMRVARGDRDGAASTFLALKLVIAAMAAALLLIAAAAIYLLFPHAMDFAEGATGGMTRATVLILIGYGLMALQGSSVGAGYRATNGYAVGGYISVTMVMLEAVTALTCVAAGGGLFQAALAYLIVRSIGTAILSLVLRRRVPWLHSRDWRAAVGHIRRLLEPAFSALALPAAQALSLQGAVLVIGSFVGPAAVPLFTTIRTLTRTALQFTMIVNVSVMPSFTVASATGDEARKTQLVLLCLLASAAVLVPATPVLLAGGRTIILLWTHGRIDPPFVLLALMTLTMLLNGAWVPISNLILSINAHSSFSYYFLLVSAAGLGLSAALAGRFGIDGVGCALVFVDALMLRRILKLARAMGMLDPALLRPALGGAIAAIRSAAHR